MGTSRRTSSPQPCCRGTSPPGCAPSNCRRPSTPNGRRSGSGSRRGPRVARGPDRPAPCGVVGAVARLPRVAWLAIFVIVPGYVVLAIAFGTIDPIFRSPVPAWNPLTWTFGQFTFVFDHLAGAQGFFGPAIVRTIVYVTVAIVLCLAISF